jgi:TAG lipase/steryl ester hydrolase/phospholipase A2/LPA acyltransferase
MDIGSLVLGQRYSGDITIVPVDYGTQFFDIMSNPTPEFMEAAMHKGERATWPKLAMIKNHLAIELLIDQAFHRVKEHVSFSDSVSDLRRLQISQNGKSKHASGGRVRPGSKGSYGSARSTIVPRPLQNRRPDHRSVKSMLDAPSDIQDDFVMKVAGEASSPSSTSSSSSFVLGSEDEDEIAVQHYPQIVEPDAIPSTIQSEPNTPHTEKNSFFNTPPRSGSPIPPVPISLTMTAAHPRPRSPTQARHKSQAHRTESKGTAPAATIRFGGEQSLQAKKLNVLQMPKKLLGKRSGSTGRSGMSEVRKG